MTELVSCVIPVFNGERYLRQAIESVLAQTYPGIEVIVVDDGSTDGSPTVAQSFGGRVTYLRQDNGGASAARNAGIRHASGTLIGFLDADDLWEPDKTARQVATLADDPDIDYCVTRMENFWSPDVPQERRDDGVPRPDGPYEGFSPITLLARRSVFDLLPFDTGVSLVEDWDWFLRAHERSVPFTLLPGVLARRRLHQANQTRDQFMTSRRALLPLLHRSLVRRGLLGGTRKGSD